MTEKLIFKTLPTIVNSNFWKKDNFWQSFWKNVKFLAFFLDIQIKNFPEGQVPFEANQDQTEPNVASLVVVTKVDHSGNYMNNSINTKDRVTTERRDASSVPK